MNSEELHGQIECIVYTNEENGYTVPRVRLIDSSTGADNPSTRRTGGNGIPGKENVVTVVGTLISPTPGETDWDDSEGLGGAGKKDRQGHALYIPSTTFRNPGSPYTFRDFSPNLVFSRLSKRKPLYKKYNQSSEWSWLPINAER